jgi:hypothetical protein
MQVNFEAGQNSDSHIPPVIALHGQFQSSYTAFTQHFRTQKMLKGEL